MRLDRLACIEDLRRAARRRLPRMIYDFIDGGAESEAGLARNREAFARLLLQPRALVDVSTRDQSMQLFGRDLRMPVGIAPVGLANLVRPGADLMMARAAVKAGAVYVLSTAGTTSLETIAAETAGSAWYQLYVSNDDAITADLLRRAAAAGYSVLVVTVDVAVPGKRDRDIRNGFGLPLRLSPANLCDFALHPRWSLAALANGLPRFETLARYAPGGGDARSLAAFMAAQISSGFDWDRLRRIRDDWAGRLVVKGIMAAEDAAECVRLGADGIIVSNHGGRQCDAAPASIEALPRIRAAVGPDTAVMLDGGVRRGADVVRAVALGADYVFAARCFLYGAAAAGEPGVERAFTMLRQEIDGTLGQLGRRTLHDTGPQVIWA